MADMNKVLCNVQQILTPAQQLQARKNIGAFASSSAAPEYDPEATYPIIGTLRMHEGVLYRSKVAINTAEDWTEAHWEVDSVSAELDELKSDPNWVNVTSKLGDYSDTQTATNGRYLTINYCRKLAMLEFRGYVAPTASGAGIKLFSFNTDIVKFSGAEYYTKSGSGVIYITCTPFNETTTFRKPYSLTGRDVVSGQNIEFQFLCPLNISTDEFDSYLATH